MIRTFLAFDISEEVQKNLGILIETIRPQSKEVKWFEPGNFHVTSKFFGNTEEDQLGPIGSLIEKELVGFKTVRLKCVGIGCFPKWQYPKVIWAGLRGETQGLIDLQKKLEESFVPLGFPKENREFKLHLTLGRVRIQPKSDGWVKTLEGLNEKLFGETVVDHLTLYKSELTKKGPIYTAIREFRCRTFAQTP